MSVGNSSRLFNIESSGNYNTEPEELSYIENTQRFHDPEQFVNTGFSITQSVSRRKQIRKLILSNEDINSYHVRTKYPSERGRKMIVYE